MKNPFILGCDNERYSTADSRMNIFDGSLVDYVRAYNKKRISEETLPTQGCKSTSHKYPSTKGNSTKGNLKGQHFDIKA